MSSKVPLLFFLGTLALSSCASFKEKRTNLINGKKIEFVFLKKTSPTVVFESGLGGHLEWWSKIAPEISKSKSVFLYNRPGIGRSEKVTNSRDAEQIVKELRANLKSLNIEPPYVLVGHSLGGLYLQLFARKHPDEVVGLVLVDSTHPLQMNGEGAPEHWSWWLKTYMNIFLSNEGQRELSELNRSGEQVLSYASANLKFPIYILTATEPEIGANDYERDLIEKRINLAKLYPNSKQVFVRGGHAIPLDSPDAVISAIEQVISQSKH